MTLELNALSKGDAERKASGAGMIVAHVTPMNSDTFEETESTMALKPIKDEGGSSNTKKLIIVLIVLAVLALLLNFVVFPMMSESGL